MEDVILVCYKKTEFLGLLLEEWERIHKHRNIVTYLSSNTFQLRIGCNPETSCIVSTKIKVQAVKSILDDSAMEIAYENQEKISTQTPLIISVCEGSTIIINKFIIKY